MVSNLFAQSAREMAWLKSLSSILMKRGLKLIDAEMGCSHDLH